EAGALGVGWGQGRPRSRSSLSSPAPNRASPRYAALASSLTPRRPHNSRLLRASDWPGTPQLEEGCSGVVHKGLPLMTSQASAASPAVQGLDLPVVLQQGWWWAGRPARGLAFGLPMLTL